MAANNRNSHKKRKGRQNLNNRERTFTTLTEDSNDDQGPLFNNQPYPQAFPAYTSNGYMPSNFQPGPEQQYLPPGQNDLEVLEKLKDTIKKGQHEFFRAVPQPSALARNYLGPAPSSYNSSVSSSQVPPHPEQIPSSHNGNYGPNGTPSGPGSDYSRRARHQSVSMDSWDGNAGPRTALSSPSVSNILHVVRTNFNVV